jgi:hypothetical protein
MNSKHYLIFIGLFLTLLMAGCKKETEESIPDQPDLPPENAFVQDMGGFGNSAQRSEGNYNFAALNVGVWNTILYVNLAIPVAAWYKVREVEPVWDKNISAWKWTKEYNNNSGNYTAQLHGWIQSGEVQWRMYITKQGEYNDFLWYRGTSKLDGTSGSWRLFRDPVIDQPYIDITWNNELDSDHDDIKYVNSIPNDAGNGSYIQYGRIDTTGLDIFYDIYLKADNRLIEIDYSDATTAGSVRDNVFFGDENWHCWNELHQDTTCI